MVGKNKDVVRIAKLPTDQSFFLFGARGTGKTTLLVNRFNLEPSPPKKTLFIDLLDPDQEEKYRRSPIQLKEEIVERQEALACIIIDEIQKVPELLDVVHSCIRKYKHLQFVLSGSSARKLKAGGANLLAGRAFSFHLHPLSFLEFPKNYPLNDILAWGGLPKILEYTSTLDRQRFLRAYTQTYLKEEIQLEQLVRNIVSFREFLDLSSQCNTEIINFSNISKQSGVDEKTIARYFDILVDTMVGFFLEPFDSSVRVRQSQRPKFYLFDTGIQRHLSQMTEIPLSPGTSEYGKLFEQMIIAECFRLRDYFERDFKFYYLRTKDDAEIDLIVKKPGGKVFLIEIKSTDKIQDKHGKHLISLGQNIVHKEKWILCNEKVARTREDDVRILPWRQGLKELFDVTLPERETEKLPLALPVKK
jgi:predicted AAA+ superfamily ATPase